MLNIGLVGCGYWGKNYVRIIGENSLVNFMYISDLKGEPEGLRMSPKTIFVEDYNEMLSDKNLDAVVIATPTSTHYSLTKDFLEYGKHVLVEKPLTPNLGEAEDLCRISKEKGVILMVGEIFRFNSGIQYMKESIQRGDLGEIRYIECRRVGLGPIRTDVSALWDLVSHDIYITRLLAGKNPVSVNCNGISHNGYLDDIVALSLNFPEKLFATIYASWEHATKERQIIVGGNKKAIKFDDIQIDNKIIVFDKGVDYQPKTGEYSDFQASIRDGDVYIPKLKIKEPLLMEFNHFIECINNPLEKCNSSGLEGLITVKILEACEKSRQNGGAQVTIS